MACQFINKCNSKNKNKNCYSTDLIPLCDLRIQFRKEQTLRRASINRLLKQADKLNW